MGTKGWKKLYPHHKHTHNGDAIYKEEEIQNISIQYYKDIFRDGTMGTYNGFFQNDQKWNTQDQANPLKTPLFKEEVYNDMRNLKSNAALGPNITH